MVVVSGPTGTVPLVASGPVQPPEETQLWALVAFQLSEVCAPLAIVVAAATKVTVGALSATMTSVWAVLVPLGPSQVTANVVVSMMLETVMVPLTGCGPLIPLVPTQDVADVVCSVRFMLPPALMLVAAGVRETSGPVVLAALPDPQAASAAEAHRTSAARINCAVSLIPKRVMSCSEFFFWIRRPEMGNKLRLRRNLKDNI